MLLPLLLGQGAAGPNNYTLTCSAGSFALAGVSANVLRSKRIVSTAGSYTQTGRSANLLRSKRVVANAGSYAQTGVSSTLLRSKLVTALAGAYPLTGQSAILTYTPGAVNYSITAQTGAFTLSGVSAGLLKSKRIDALVGSFAESGVSAQISKGRVLTSQTGSYSLAGQSATITRTGLVATDYALTCQPGAFLLGGDFVDDGYAEPGYAGNAEIRISRPIAEVNLSPERKWYVRKNKQILIFSSAEEADAFIEADEAAEKAVEQAQKTSRRARKRVRQKVYDSAGIAPESVQIDWLAQLVSRYAIQVDLPSLIARQDFDEVMRVYALAMQMQDEEDAEILLMMG